MTYDFAPGEPPPPPADSDLLLPGERRRKLEKLEIEDDLECVHCGYNLRGLTKKHRCPECGTPAGMSLLGDLLQYAPVHWLKSVRNGLAMLLWAIGIGIAAFVNIGPSPGFGVLLDVCSAVLAFSGVMFLTTPEPKMLSVATGFGLRESIRTLALVNFACALTIMFSPSMNFTTVMARISLLFWIALLLTLAVFLRRFAARIPESDLERPTTQVIWGFAGSLAVCLFFGLYSLAFGRFTAILGPAPCIASVGLFSALFFACWFMLLLYKYYAIVRWSVHDAERQFDPPPMPKLNTDPNTEDWTDAGTS